MYHRMEIFLQYDVMYCDGESTFYNEPTGRALLYPFSMFLLLLQRTYIYEN